MSPLAMSPMPAFVPVLPLPSTRPVLNFRCYRRTTNARTFPRLSISTPSTDSSSTALTDASNLSPAFSAQHSGEWLGKETEYSSRTTEPLPLPDRYIPDAFREWGMIPTSMETMTSTLVAPHVVELINTWMLPAVGCEADAVTTERKEETLPRDGQTMWTFEDGSLLCANKNWQMHNFAQRWLVCLTRQKQRVWIEWGRVDEQVGKIRVRGEKWESEYCRGEVLSGCGGGGGVEGVGDGEGVWNIKREGWRGDVLVQEEGQREGVSGVELGKGVWVNVEKVESGWQVEARWGCEEGIAMSAGLMYGDGGEVEEVWKSVEVREH